MGLNVFSRLFSYKKMRTRGQNFKPKVKVLIAEPTWCASAKYGMALVRHPLLIRRAMHRIV